MKACVALASAFGILSLTLAAPAGAPAQPVAIPALSTERTPLPLSKVVLYSSGVGYFEHDGTVHDRAQVEFRFQANQVNDLLKSLVVEDLSGGQVSAVTYGSRDPIAKTLSGFAINLTRNPGVARLLDQIRGERVEVTAPNAIMGTILGVEQKEQAAGSAGDGRRPAVQVDYLNLLTGEGLRSIPLPQVQRIQILNDRLNAELQQALSVLAAGHDTQKKSVTITFNGEGSRRVRVAYITETPVWKTAYRLVLDGEQPAFLQGWAIVENTTDLDWRNVQLSLVSGRPISFIMDLYQPLYATRPIVAPDLYASLRPRIYEDATEDRAADRAGQSEHAEESGMEARAFAKSRRAAELPSRPPPAPQEGPEMKAQMNLREGVASAAEGHTSGELFEYRIQTPVDLGRDTSAMLPIVGQEVEGRKVSIYSQAAHATHPLHGFRLTNTTPLYLMQGPMTIFDGGAYAGDARMEDLAPGQDRLISYALDLKTDVAPRRDTGQQELVSIALRKGVLIATHKLMEETTYRITNRDQKSKVVLIEHPYRTDWDLLEPIHQIERTRDVYRFTVPVETGQAGYLRVREEKFIRQTVHLMESNTGAIAAYVQAKQISAKVREVLQRIIGLRDRLGQTGARRLALEQHIREITQEQTRIRENMSKLAQQSDLYNRYVKKLDQQETEIEKLRKEIAALKATEDEQKRELNEYLMDLDLT